MNMDYIREFLAVAECFSFSEAAKVSFLSVSAISRHISALEREMGCTLLRRNYHYIELTSNGQDFYNKIKPIIDAYDRVIDEATQGKKANIITIGMHFAEGHKKVFRYIKQFMEDNPDISLDVVNTTNHDFTNMLLNKQIDIAMEYYTDAHQHEEISCVYLEMERFVVAYPSSRDLENEPVDIASLKNEKVFLPCGKNHPGAVEIVKLIETANKTEIKNIQEVDSINDVFLQVALGKGLTIIPEEYVSIAPEGVSTIFFKEMPIRPLTALFRKHDKKTGISKFVSFLRRMNK